MQTNWIKVVRQQLVAVNHQATTFKTQLVARKLVNKDNSLNSNPLTDF